MDSFARDRATGLWLPRHARPLEILAVTNLIGFGAGGGVPVTYPTWNPSDKNAGVTLSNGNKTAATGASGGLMARATGGRSSGLVYVEATVDTAGSGGLFGVADATASLSNYLAADTHGWAYYQDGRKVNNASFPAYGSALSNGNILQMAVDFTAGKIWWGINNTWQGSGDPAAGTNAAFSGLTGTLMVAIGTASNNHQITVNWGETAFSYTPPSGFSAWSVP